MKTHPPKLSKPGETTTVGLLRRRSVKAKQILQNISVTESGCFLWNGGRCASRYPSTFWPELMPPKYKDRPRGKVNTATLPPTQRYAGTPHPVVRLLLQLWFPDVPLPTYLWRTCGNTGDCENPQHCTNRRGGDVEWCKAMGLQNRVWTTEEIREAVRLRLVEGLTAGEVEAKTGIGDRYVNELAKGRARAEETADLRKAHEYVARRWTRDMVRQVVIFHLCYGVKKVELARQFGTSENRIGFMVKGTLHGEHTEDIREEWPEGAVCIHGHDKRITGTTMRKIDGRDTALCSRCLKDSHDRYNQKKKAERG